MQMFVFGSPPMCFRSSHPASFLRATCPSWPPTFWTGSPAFLLTSWSSSPPCNPHRWDQSHYGCFAKNLQESRRKQIFFPPNEVDREHPIISPSTFLFVINFFFFCYSCLVYLSFSKKLRDGTNQNESYLTIFCCIFYLLKFYFCVWKCSQDKIKRLSKTLWPIIFLFLFFMWS